MRSLQVRLTTAILLIALVALNLWLFRIGVLAGLLGLSVTKHVVIAWLCQVVGLNQAHSTRA